MTAASALVAVRPVDARTVSTDSTTWLSSLIRGFNRCCVGVVELRNQHEPAVATVARIVVLAIGVSAAHTVRRKHSDAADATSAMSVPR